MAFSDLFSGNGDKQYLRGKDIGIILQKLESLENKINKNEHDLEKNVLSIINNNNKDKELHSISKGNYRLMWFSIIVSVSFSVIQLLLSIFKAQ